MTEPQDKSAMDLEQAAALLPRLVGLPVGMLYPEELAAFELAVAAGIARRSYTGVAGFMGVAKVALV